MGCDIHCYIEWEEFVGQDGKPYIGCLAHEVDFGRNYQLFALMAGVRYDENRMDGKQPLFEPRGIPENLSWRASGDYYLTVTDDPEKAEWDNWVLHEKATSWVTQGISVWAASNKVSDPDAHTPSWLTADELQQVHDAYLTIESALNSWYQRADEAPHDGGRVAGKPDRMGWIYVEKGERVPNHPYLPLLAIIAALRVLEDGKPGRARLTFWFDN